MPKNYISVFLLFALTLLTAYGAADTDYDYTTESKLFNTQDGKSSKYMPKFSVQGNPILDALLNAAQKDLLNYTIVNLPPFKFTNQYVSAVVPTSTVAGLVGFNRVGDVIIQALNPSKTSSIQFAFGWPQLTSVSTLQIYIFQYWVLVYPKTGTLTIEFFNATSSQVLVYDAVAQSIRLAQYNLTMNNVNVALIGFGQTAQLGAEILTAFLNENRDLFLSIVSYVFKALVNACFSAVQSIIFQNVPVIPLVPAPVLPVPALPVS